MPYWFDGNNLIGQSAAAAKADVRTRREFLSTLSSYRRSGGGRFVVFFDGDDSTGSAAPPGIAVRYSAPLSADEDICRRLREAQKPSEVIVVTNDHTLSARCRDEGASVMTWHRFSEKMQSRKRVNSAKRNEVEKVNVDDWLRYFGIDEK